MKRHAVNLLIPKGESKHRYNPTRDLAYVWQHVCGAACDELDNPDRWCSSFAAYLRREGVTGADILEVARAYARFMAAVKSDARCRSVEEALSQAGVFQCKVPALMAYMARLGQIMTGLWWTTIRDLEGEFGLPVNDQFLVEAAESGGDYVGKRMAAI